MSIFQKFKHLQESVQKGVKCNNGRKALSSSYVRFGEEISVLRMSVGSRA